MGIYILKIYSNSKYNTIYSNSHLMIIITIRKIIFDNDLGKVKISKK